MVLIAAIAGCDHQVVGPRAHPPLAPAFSVGASPVIVRDAERPFAELAKVIPSSAGFYYDKNGDLVVRVRDTTEFGRVATAIATLVSGNKIRLSPEASPNPPVVVQGADFTFNQLAVWRDTVGAYFDRTGVPGVVSLDLDEVGNRVTIGVHGSADLVAIRAQLTALGVPSNAIRFRASGLFRFDVRKVESSKWTGAARGLAFFTDADIDSTASTMIGGLRIGLQWSSADATCTLAFPVTHVQSGVEKTGFITASHCTEKLFGYDGDEVYQTQIQDGGASVGYEDHDPDFYTCGLYKCSVSDAAFIKTNSGVSVGLGLLAKSTGTNYMYDPSNPWIITRTETGNLYVNETVTYTGGTSGYHTASITNTCVDFWHDELFYKTTCEDETDGAVSGGDSGGPVFIPVVSGGHEVIAAGLISGDDGNGMTFTRVSRIADDFSGEGATVSFIAPATISPPTLSGTTDANNHPALSWTAVSGVLSYDVYRFQYDSSCSPITTGDGYVGSTTLTAYGDASVTVGGGPLCPYVQYWVTASTNSAYTGASNVASFTTQ